MKDENDISLLNNIKSNLTDKEWNILQFSTIPNILIEEMLFFRFHKEFENSVIKEAIHKMKLLGIFITQNNTNIDTFIIIHDRIKDLINNFSDIYYIESCKILVDYYNSYIQKKGGLSKQFYNDKLLCQLRLGNNYEWRCCYQFAMENGEDFECHKLLEIYRKSLETNSNNILDAWFQYYIFHNNFKHKKQNFFTDLNSYYTSTKPFIEDKELSVYFENMVGLLYLYQDDYNNALFHFRKALEFINSYREKMAIEYNICITFFYKEQYTQSKKTLLQIYTNIPNKEIDLFVELKLKLIQAAIDTRMYNLDQAISYFEETIVLAKKYQNQLKMRVPLYLSNKDPRPIYATLDKDIYNYIGEVYLIKGDFEQAILYHQMGLSCKEAYDDISGMAWAHNDLGKVYYLSGNTQLAKEHLDKSFDLFSKSDDKTSQCYPLLEYSYVYQYNGDTKKAINSLKESLLLFKCKKQNKNMVYVLNHLGRLYQSQGFLRLADKIFKFCLFQLDEKSFVKQKRGWICNNLARNYLYLSDYEKSLCFFQESLDIFEQIFEKRGISYIINNIAEVKAKQFHYKEAYQLFMKSYYLKENMGDTHAICYTCRELAELYIKLNDLENAHYYAEKSLRLCNKGNYIMLKGDILKTWGNYYTKTQQYKKAWNYYLDALNNYNIQFFYSRVIACIEKVEELPFKKQSLSNNLLDKEAILRHMQFEEEILLEQTEKLLEELS